MTASSDAVIDPLVLLRSDRAIARQRNDAMANLCAFATATAGAANVRTLVLRDIDEALAVFFSATSPKARELGDGVRPQAVVYLPSLNVQYRLWLRLRPVPRELLEKHWPQRPIAAKQLDWFYNLHTPQSAAFADRAALRAAIADISTHEQASMTKPPKAAVGCFLDPDRVERLRLDDNDPPHDRRLYELVGATWHEAVLVP